MEKIYLSDSGPKISPAVYGFYRWKENEVTEEKIAAIVDLCLESGINTFDHADIYGGYQVEKLFGKIIRQKNVRREDIVLFTKCGIVEPHASKPDVRIRHYDTSGEHILESVENSLRNLQTDYIDIFLLNQFDPLANLEETANTLYKIKKAGKIKHIGLVNFSVFQHQALAAFLQLPIVTNHTELNLLNTTALDNGQIDYLKQRNIRPLVTSPLAEGQIANSTEKVPLRVRAKLEELSIKYNAGIESLAAAWLVKIGAVPLLGTMSEQRIKNIVSTFHLNLERQDWYELYAAAHEK